ncbi:hypothetical protein JYU29_05550 [Tianweitania sp. BSSL-BM11]|uniref:Uncharacterized protein n=1 Tax=Tianweitania aestuarii TaxID=2814886 RepID=A0ABS5RSX4_9HYPH|nr:hypothetical protein [Tianweitania aestuarii]MBS9720150.1 hypothetical protein [Tianweitania aestuarii]
MANAASSEVVPAFLKFPVQFVFAADRRIRIERSVTARDMLRPATFT